MRKVGGKREVKRWVDSKMESRSLKHHTSNQKIAERDRQARELGTAVANSNYARGGIINFPCALPSQNIAGR